MMIWSVYLPTLIITLLLSLLLPYPTFAQTQPQNIVRPLASDSSITSPLIEGFINSAQQIAREFSTQVSTEILTLLNYAFLIWLLLQIAQMVLGMTNGASTFWNIVRRSALYMIVVFMLTSISTGTYWQWFVEEPIRLASVLSAEAMGRTECGSTTAAEAAHCLARGMEAVFVNPLYASWQSISVTQFSLESLFSGAAISQYAAGAFLALVAFIGLVYFAFFILDVVLRILILAMFSGIFVAAFLFNPTRGWATSAAWNLISSVATLVVGSAVLAMLDAAIQNSLGGGGWPAVISEIAASGSRYDSPINLDRVVFWQALFLCLVSVGVAKAISHMMAAVFYSSPAGSPMADKITNIASIPVKATITATTIGAGFLTYLGLKSTVAAREYSRHKFGKKDTSLAEQDTKNFKSRIGYTNLPPGGGGGPYPNPDGGGGSNFTPSGGGTGGPFTLGSGGSSGGGGTSTPGYNPNNTQSPQGMSSQPFGPGFHSASATNTTTTNLNSTSPLQASATPSATSSAEFKKTLSSENQTPTTPQKKKSKSSYKTSFTYKTLRELSRDAENAIDPLSNTGT